MDEFDIKNQVIIDSSGFIIKAEIADSEIFNLKPDLFYTSYKNKSFYHMQGGINGKALDGHYQRTDSTGQLLIEGYYSKGLKNGLWKSWYPNGQLKTLQSYKMGLANGEFIDYNFNGQVQKMSRYKNGLLKKETLYKANGLRLVNKYSKGEIAKTDSIISQ